MSFEKYRKNVTALETERQADYRRLAESTRRLLAAKAAPQNHTLRRDAILFVQEIWHQYALQITNGHWPGNPQAASTVLKFAAEMGEAAARAATDVAYLDILISANRTVMTGLLPGQSRNEESSAKKGGAEN